MPLAGLRVLVTRPAERAEELARAIAEAGGHPVRLPVIVIVAATPPAAALEAIDQADLLLFTSPAAVSHGVEHLGLAADKAAEIAAVGPGTATALRRHRLEPDIVPASSADSEGLLAEPGLARERVAGRRVVIVRGQGGRELLARELMARGATVDYAEVYRRERPPAPDPGLASACDIVTATSNEGLCNLLALFDSRGQAELRARPIAVSSPRAATLARERGFKYEPQIADASGDAGLLAAIHRCAAQLAAGTGASGIEPSDNA